MSPIVYLILPALLVCVVLASVWLDRWSVPVILVALGTGIVCGSDVLNLWHFDDMVLTNEFANLALVFILFHGGFVTKLADFRVVALPAGGLATWGVLLTAAVTFSVLYGVLGWSMELSVLLAVIISSTDAAAIFSILRRQSLPTRLSSTVEIESAANDPMAILLTTVAVATFASARSSTMSPCCCSSGNSVPVQFWGMAQDGLRSDVQPRDTGGPRPHYVLFVGFCF